MSESNHSNQNLVTINPSTGNELKKYTCTSYQEVNEAIEGCHNAFLDWKNKPLDERAETVIGSALMIEEIMRDAGLPENLFSVLKIIHEQSNDVIKNDLERVPLTGSRYDLYSFSGIKNSTSFRG